MPHLSKGNGSKYSWHVYNTCLRQWLINMLMNSTPKLLSQFYMLGLYYLRHFGCVQSFRHTGMSLSMCIRHCQVPGQCLQIINILFLPMIFNPAVLGQIYIYGMYGSWCVKLFAPHWEVATWDYQHVCESIDSLSDASCALEANVFILSHPNAYKCTINHIQIANFYL